VPARDLERQRAQIVDAGYDLHSVSMVSNTVDFDASPVDRASAQMFLQAPAGDTIVGDALAVVPPDPLEFTTTVEARNRMGEKYLSG
jgi:hypothetical protein